MSHEAVDHQGREYVKPNGASTNKIECFFSILTRKLLWRGEFSPREDLIRKILNFIEHHSVSARPFKWVYDAKVAA